MSSLVPLVNEFNGFVVLVKRFRDFSRSVAGTWLCNFVLRMLPASSFCTASHSLPYSGGPMPANRCKLSTLVDFRQPVILRQQSYTAEFSFFACVDLAHIEHVYSAVQ